MGTLINRTRSKFMALVAAACLVATFAGQTVGQSSESISTKYIAKDAFLVIALHPAKIANCADKDSETTKYVLDMMKKFTGLDVKGLEQIVVQIGAPDKEIDDPGDVLGIVFRFSKNIDPEDLVDKMGSDFDLDKQDLEGQPLYVPSSDSNPCMYFPNKKTMIMAVEDRIRVLVDGSGMGEGAKVAKRIKTGDHLGISFVMGENDAQKAIMEQVMDEMPLEEMGIDSDMVKNVKRGEIHINLKGNDFVSGKLQCADGDTADKVEGAAKDALSELEGNLEEAESQLGSAPPEIAEVAEEILDLAFEAIENAKVTTDGSNVNINVEVKGGMSKVVDGVAKGLEQLFQMLEQFGGGF